MGVLAMKGLLWCGWLTFSLVSLLWDGPRPGGISPGQAARIVGGSCTNFECVEAFCFQRRGQQGDLYLNTQGQMACSIVADGGRPVANGTVTKWDRCPGTTMECPDCGYSVATGCDPDICTYFGSVTRYYCYTGPIPPESPDW